MKVDATGTGLVVGESHIDLSGLLDVAAVGGEFTVSRRVTELRHVDISGALVPKALAGKPELDTAAVLALTTMQIVDMFGVVDEEASAALPDAGAADDVITASLGLPELPPVPLTLGVPVTTRRQDVEQFGSDEIELTIETTHTLVRIDHQDGRRLAEITSVAQATASRTSRAARCPSSSPSAKPALSRSSSISTPGSRSARRRQAMTRCRSDRTAA
ncbi:hypothetical protein [Nannocystis pusilla]|uniref:hypothetical protein n=1 Tax=Nannocystis pusilla TaxID=889268 RepID=UPI003B768DFF